MTISYLTAGAALLLPVAVSRFIFLPRYRAGWAMYLANIFLELLAKTFKTDRFRLEFIAALTGLSALYAGGVSLGAVAGLAAALLALELANRLWERRLLTAAYVSLDSIGIASGPNEQAYPRDAAGYPAPSAYPELILNVTAPFVERSPHYSLGLLVVGMPFDIELIIGNHTLVPTQTPVRVELRVPPAWRCGGEECQMVGPIRSSAVVPVRWSLRPTEPAAAGTIEVVVTWGPFRRSITIYHDGCRSGNGLKIKNAAISRYPGGRRSAFAWRGDMDLYDTSSLQSIEGLETALNLAARYCFPQTLFLSTRLSLDEKAAREWALHYGVDRGAAEIPRFVTWLRDNVDLRHACEYPCESARRYVVELGNHGHLHYDTDAAAAAENGWMPRARMGAGKYSWVGTDCTSLGEQRDNALEAQHWCQRLLGFTPRSWAKPGRCNDRFSPHAMEAAGCEVLSGSDIRARDNVLFQPPPHHPGGTSAVELTTRYPGDPQHIYHVAMLLFWLHRSHRRALPMIYMCHQHMRQFNGHACTRFTEYLLRYVLTNFNGDFYINTVFGIGKYWREVLSPVTGRLTVTVSGEKIIVDNHSDLDITDLPIDIMTADGARLTVLVSVLSNTSKTIEFTSSSC